MPTETEIKLPLPIDVDLRPRLREAGAQFVSQLRERDTFFDRPDGSLRAGNIGLRLRIEWQEADHPQPVAMLTYKGARKPGRVKSREELEFTVGSAALAKQMLENLGFAPTLTFEKKRERWRLGDCNVELDELPRLGRFVEIEGPDEAAVIGVCDTLKLDADRCEQRSYVRMLAESCSEQEKATPLLFDDSPDLGA